MTDKVRRTKRTLPFGTTAELEFWCGRGSVTLLPVHLGEEATVEVVSPHADDIGVEVARGGNVVRVEVERAQSYLRESDRDHTQIALRVPRSVRAHVHADSGSIEARDLGPCALRIETGAGRIGLFDVYGQLRLSTGAGQIAGRGISGSIGAETNAGAILLEISSLDRGDHYIHASAGTIRLELARQLNARVEISSRRGSVHNDYPACPDASAVLRVSTDVGSIHVRGVHGNGEPRFLNDDWPLRPARQSEDSAMPDPGEDESRSEGRKTPDVSTAAEREREMERILKMVETGESSIQDAKAKLEDLVRELAEGRN